MGSTGEVATTTEIVVLVLHFLKKNGFDESYQALILEGREKLDLKDPQENVRDLQDILNEYLYLLERSNGTNSIVKSDIVGRKFRAKVTKAFKDFGRLMEDYIAVREYLSKRDTVKSSFTNDNGNIVQEEDEEDEEEESIFNDAISPVSSARSSSTTTNNNGKRPSSASSKRTSKHSRHDIERPAKRSNVSVAYPGNKKVSTSSSSSSTTTASPSTLAVQSFENAVPHYNTYPPQPNQQYQQSKARKKSNNTGKTTSKKQQTSVPRRQPLPSNMQTPIPAPMRPEVNKQLEVHKKEQKEEQKSTLSQVVGTMSEQLKKRQRTTSQFSASNLSSNNPTGSTTNKPMPSASTLHAKTEPPQREEKSTKDDPSSLVRELPSNDLELSNMSFIGSVSPLELDVNLTRSRIAPMDENVTSLADMGFSSASKTFDFDLDGTKTNKSLLFSTCNEVSLGSILEGTGSFLGNPTASLPGLPFQNSSSPNASPSAPNFAGFLPENKQQQGGSKQQTQDIVNVRQQTSTSSSDKPSKLPAEKKMKRRITPTPIRAKSVPSNTPIAAAIPDVESFLTSVHGAR